MAFKNGGIYRFIVLVPHANVRAAFNGYRRELSAGSAGAPAAVFSFPAVAPAALVGAPASKAELKSMAARFRRQSYENGGGKIRSEGRAEAVSLPDGKTIAGPRLSVEPPPLPEGVTVLERFNRLILGALIFPGPVPALPPCPPLKFSAAAFANMILEELPYEHSYSWTIGEPQWLPRIIRENRF